MFLLRSRQMAVGLALSIAVAAQSGAAQSSGTSSSVSVNSGSPGHMATLVGAVIDSIHLAPLVGATVLLNGTTLSTQTDDHGKFRIDSIPPGTYRVAVFHPLLDTLGVSIGTMPMSMGADTVRELVLTTPSAQTVIANACPEAKRRLGAGAIMGHVFDPDTHAPIDSVRVSLAWTDISVGKDIGVRRIPTLREGMTDASGAFIICGVPVGIKGTIEADRGKAQTAEVPVALDESPLLMQSLTLALVKGTDSIPPTGQAVLTGRVTDPQGLPISDASIVVQGATPKTSSAKDGSFRLSGLPSGTRSVLVRRVGFAPVELPVSLAAATPTNVVVKLDKTTPTLAPVKVVGSMDSALKADGFTDRRRMGMGYYLGPEDIARRMPQQLSSLFQMIPGFQIAPGVGTGMQIRSIRDGCVTYVIDGVPWQEGQAGQLDYQFKPEQLMAIETYSAAAAPAQFVAPGRSSCSVVIIWTNRTVPH